MPRSCVTHACSGQWSCKLTAISQRWNCVPVVWSPVSSAQLYSVIIPHYVCRPRSFPTEPKSYLLPGGLRLPAVSSSLPRHRVILTAEDKTDDQCHWLSSTYYWERGPLNQTIAVLKLMRSFHMKMMWFVNRPIQAVIVKQKCSRILTVASHTYGCPWQTDDGTDCVKVNFEIYIADWKATTFI